MRIRLKDLCLSYLRLDVGLFDVLLYVPNYLGSRTVGNSLGRNVTCRPRFEKMSEYYITRKHLMEPWTPAVALFLFYLT
jgi:hypothetical protein